MGLSFYVERLSNGRVEWLRIASGSYKEWLGCFCLLGDIPPEHVPVFDAGRFYQ